MTTNIEITGEGINKKILTESIKELLDRNGIHFKVSQDEYSFIILPQQLKTVTRGPLFGLLK